MLDPVIRYMTVVVSQDNVPADRASDIDEEAYQRAANTAADEEEIMLGRADVDSDLDRSDVVDDDDIDVAAGSDEFPKFVEEPGTGGEEN
jgi:hypothetical protein